MPVAARASAGRTAASSRSRPANVATTSVGSSSDGVAHRLDRDRDDRQHVPLDQERLHLAHIDLHVGAGRPPRAWRAPGPTGVFPITRAAMLIASPLTE